MGAENVYTWLEFLKKDGVGVYSNVIPTYLLQKGSRHKTWILRLMEGLENFIDTVIINELDKDGLFVDNVNRYPLYAGGGVGGLEYFLQYVSGKSYIERARSFADIHKELRDSRGRLVEKNGVRFFCNRGFENLSVSKNWEMFLGECGLLGFVTRVRIFSSVKKYESMLGGMLEGQGEFVVRPVLEDYFSDKDIQGTTDDSLSLAEKISKKREELYTLDLEDDSTGIYNKADSSFEIKGSLEDGVDVGIVIPKDKPPILDYFKRVRVLDAKSGGVFYRDMWSGGGMFFISCPVIKYVEESGVWRYVVEQHFVENVFERVDVFLRNRPVVTFPIFNILFLGFDKISPLISEYVFGIEDVRTGGTSKSKKDNFVVKKGYGVGVSERLLGANVLKKTGVYAQYYASMDFGVSEYALASGGVGDSGEDETSGGDEKEHLVNDLYPDILFEIDDGEHTRDIFTGVRYFRSDGKYVKKKKTDLVSVYELAGEEKIGFRLSLDFFEVKMREWFKGLTRDKPYYMLGENIKFFFSVIHEFKEV